MTRGAHPWLCLALAATTGLAGCVDPSELPIAKRPGLAPPGQGGREVLWISPRPRHPLGDLHQAAVGVVTTIAELDAESAKGVESLRDYLDDNRVRVRQAAMAALALSEHPDAPLALLAAVVDPHPVVQGEARLGIAEVGAAARDTLFDRAIRGKDAAAARGAAAVWPVLLESTPADVRSGRLIAALTDTADELTAGLLLADHCKLLAEPVLAAARASESALPRAAAQACDLDSFGPASDGDPTALIAALRNDEPEPRRIAALLTERVAAHIAVERKEDLLEALERAGRTMSGRTAIAVAAAQHALDQPTALRALAIWVRGGTAEARLDALLTLRRIGRATGRLEDPSLAPALERAYTDRDATVRVTTAEVAGLTRDGRVAGPLVELLEDPVEDVRVAAAWAIGEAGAKLAAGALIDYGINDTSKPVNDASYVALHHLVHAHPLPPRDAAGEWLDEPGDVGGRPFWGRDFQRWRRWYQLER